MYLQISFESMLQLLVDGLIACKPQKSPSLIDLQNCRLVSHRGEHDNKNVYENTLAAFDTAVECGVWGIEFDIRWSRDLQPVVIHDADCRRVFGSPIEIAKISLTEIQSELPQVPSLQQVIQRYAGKAHLMVELKQERFTDIDQQCETLKTLFDELTPGEDYHILCLKPEIFELFDIIPAQAMLPVAEFNVRQLSELAIEKNYAGVSGQYLLVNNRIVNNHQRNRQKTGTGFVRSRYCLYRELNREVDWIFTNHAVKLHAIRQALLQKLTS